MQQSIYQDENPNLKILNELLKTNYQYYPFYGEREFSNHLPIILGVMYQISFESQNLSKFQEQYLEYYPLDKIKPESMKKLTRMEENNWNKYLGQKEMYLSFVQFFEICCEKYVLRMVLKYFLPSLIQSMFTACFHPLLRISIGSQCSIASEVIHGLAYLSAFSVPLTVSDMGDFESRQPATPNEMLTIILNSQKFIKYDFNYGKMEERVMWVIKETELPQMFQPLKANFETQLAFIIIKLYYQNLDFTMLHLLTALPALREMSHYLDQKQIDLMWNTFWFIACAAYITIGCPYFDVEITHKYNINEWTDIFKYLTTQEDEHTILLIYSCWKEFIYFKGNKGSEIFIQVAARELQQSHSDQIQEMENKEIINEFK